MDSDSSQPSGKDFSKFVTVLYEGAKTELGPLKGLFLITSLLLILAGIFFPRHDHPLPIDMALAGIGLIVFLAIFISIIPAVFAKKRRRDVPTAVSGPTAPATPHAGPDGLAAPLPLLDPVPSHRLQLLAWSGFGEPDVTLGYEDVTHKSTRLDILEYVRGIEKVTHLRYGGSLFDVLIADLEFLPRHDIGGKKLQDLSGQDYASCWRQIPTALRMSVQDRGHYKGMPLRCGLNALLINTAYSRKVLETEDICAYQSLKLSDILPRCSSRYKLGLWDWYLPTLTILLLMEGHTLREIWSDNDDTVKRVNASVDRITKDLSKKDNLHKIRKLEDPKDATDRLCDGDVWIIPGGGGWLMPLDNRKERLAIIIPGDAILWVECASIISGGDPALSRSLIRYLLAKDTQALLAQRDAYRTCPVTIDALAALADDLADVVDKNNIFEPNPNKLKPAVHFRQLPRDWRTWDRCWESFVDEYERHQAAH